LSAYRHTFVIARQSTIASLKASIKNFSFAPSLATA
jgi:hypothetical protein